MLIQFFQSYTNHMDTSLYSTWLEIDLRAIRNNIREISRISERPVMAVVKANAYGHGLVPVARAALQANAQWCAVARIEEALSLRENGIQCPILVLGYTPPERIPFAIANEIRLTVYDLKTVEQYSRQAVLHKVPLKVHLKIDTGMNRLGVFPEEAEEFINAMQRLPEIELEGMFTHFARADEPQLDITSDQIRRFYDLLHRLEKTKRRPPVVHLSNSAGALYHYAAADGDLVRGGIAIYGLHPSPAAPLPDTFQPAMTWKALIVSIKSVPRDCGVSYGHRYVTNHEEKIGVLPVGYADGFRRIGGNVVLVHGKRVPVVGTICMDQCMVQLDHVPDVKLGDEVILMGGLESERISAEEIAAKWGTINYEVVCGMAARLPRFYFDE
jgi:alanine racemase